MLKITLSLYVIQEEKILSVLNSVLIIKYWIQYYILIKTSIHVFAIQNVWVRFENMHFGSNNHKQKTK